MSSDKQKKGLARRNFLKAAGATGLGLALPVYSSRAAMGATTYRGTHWILVHAAGGWDPTFFCDPKVGNNLITRAAFCRYQYTIDSSWG